MKQERRTITGTVHARAIGDGMPKEIGGIAAVVNSVTDLGYFEEVINPGAFDYALSREYDIRCLFNHEAELILGRTKADTCNVFVNADGNLEYTWIPDYENPTHMSVVRSIMRGDITQSSFSFYVESDKWDYRDDQREKSMRTILEVRQLLDVAPVTFPAYEDATAEARNSLQQHKLILQQQEESADLDLLTIEIIKNKNHA